MKKIVALLLILSTPVFAGDPDNVSLVQGEPAPYSGILFPIPRAQRIELLTIDFSTCTKRLELANQTDVLSQKNITNLETTNTALRDENSKHNSFINQLGMFLLGSLVTTVIVFGVHKVTQ